MDPNGIADNDGTPQFNALEKILAAAERTRKFDDWMKDVRSSESPPREELEGSPAPAESVEQLSVSYPVTFEAPFHVRVADRFKSFLSEGSLRRLQARRGDLYLLVAIVILAIALRNTVGPIGIAKVKALWHQGVIGTGLAEPPSAQKTARPEARVWVDFASGVYYCPGSRKYGKTRNGQFTTEGNAHLSQYEPSSHKACQ